MDWKGLIAALRAAEAEDNDGGDSNSNSEDTQEQPEATTDDKAEDAEVETFTKAQLDEAVAAALAAQLDLSEVKKSSAAPPTSTARKPAEKTAIQKVEAGELTGAELSKQWNDPGSELRKQFREAARTNVIA